ncbi:histidine kinase dimerization/phospho-acceptor domain-containing protein [Pedobacter sp. SYP-B3415]|uniref:histidine kinase dimerization/phospho-acceptor domain-containing protein n=1 Tax=Pedobacter sp. SYP-B3415 TaxID=2496641 RepID=UPI00101D800D|nr:histidine kinase dimerization/phospho-acceptor domain-containing protein [Pedobacter sp. SYP-B3415]
MENFNGINRFLETSDFFYTIAVAMDSTYSYVSPNYDRNFAFQRGTLLGKDFFVTLHPDDIKICAEVGQQCFSDPSRLFPATLRKHDGQGGYVVTQWEMQACFDRDNQPAGIFCIGYNITEFVEVQHRLDKASSQLDEIGFIQSHKVRKPLANILALSDLLSENSSSSEQAEFLKLLRQSAGELDQVIREISGKSA